ncbi:MAG: hypothetical protein ACP5HF_00680 [Candidatus Micrarchaeia archaeon]
MQLQRKSKHILRMQSAMEYLMTYGWALLIIGIALAAFFALGVFSPNRYVPTVCTLPSGLGCSFSSLTKGVATLTLNNALPDPINVTAIGCAPNKIFTNMQTPYNPPSNQIYIPSGGMYQFNVVCQGASTLAPGQLYKGYLIINYTDDVTGFPQTIFGTLAAKVT